MAKLSTGILGPLSGTVGPVVLSSWKGEPHIKSKYKDRTKNISDKEKESRRRFASAQDWLRPITDFVRQGYKGAGRAEGFVAAKAFLLKNAMNDKGKIDPAMMKVSSGKLPLSDKIKVETNTEKRLQFTWDKSPVPGASGRDQLMLLAYDISNEQAHIEIAGEFRETGSAVTSTPFSKGRTYHVWAAFVAADRATQSDSIYLGAVKI